MVDLCKKYFAIYSRKSKYTGKGDSVFNQIEICKKNLSLRYSDIDLDRDVIIYYDEGFTGANTNRPGFIKLVDDIKEGKIRCVICYRLDRISRNVSDFSNFKKVFDKYNVTFISICENFDTSTPMGNAMLMISSVFAQLERDTIAERIKDNMLELAKTGRWLGGISPTGFKSSRVDFISIDGKKKSLYKLVQVKSEIDIVKLIFGKYLEYRSITRVCSYLDSLGIRTKNNRLFTRFSIVNILSNPVYVINDDDIYEYFYNNSVDIYKSKEEFDSRHGLMVYNKTRKDVNPNRVIKKDMKDWIVSVGKHKGIISGKDFILVNKLLLQNKNKGVRVPRENKALLNVLTCHNCGSLMRAKLKSRDSLINNERRFSYICKKKEKSKGLFCNSSNIDGNKLDFLIVSFLKDMLDKSCFLDLSDSYNLFSDNSDNLLLEKYKENERSISLLIDKIKYMDKDLIYLVEDEIRKLKSINMKIEEELDSLNLDDSFNDLDILGDYFSVFDSFSVSRKRELINMVIKNVSVCLDDVIISM